VKQDDLRATLTLAALAVLVVAATGFGGYFLSGIWAAIGSPLAAIALVLDVVLITMPEPPSKGRHPVLVVSLSAILVAAILGGLLLWGIWGVIGAPFVFFAAYWAGLFIWEQIGRQIRMMAYRRELAQTRNAGRIVCRDKTCRKCGRGLKRMGARPAWWDADRVDWCCGKCKAGFCGACCSTVNLQPLKAKYKASGSALREAINRDPQALYLEHELVPVCPACRVNLFRNGSVL
jgi:hypothetical protein